MKMACGCCEIVPDGLVNGVEQFIVQCIPAHTTMPEAVHSAWKDYACKETGCANYTPAHYPVVSKDGFAFWPLCTCGEIAQAHDAVPRTDDGSDVSDSTTRLSDH